MTNPGPTLDQMAASCEQAAIDVTQEGDMEAAALAADLRAAATTLRSLKASCIPHQCNCSRYRKGELTGGWQCPIHGQQW
jgi:hypothetical protein